MTNETVEAPGGPWTRHGHTVEGITIDGPGRPPVNRCGGPGLCRVCSFDAETIKREHAAREAALTALSESIAAVRDEVERREAMTVSAQDELRDRLAVTLAKAQDADYWTDEIAEWEGLEVWQREAFPGEYPAMAYEDRSNYRYAAQAIIDDLGLTVVEGPMMGAEWKDGNFHPVCEQRVVGRWEKQ